MKEALFVKTPVLDAELRAARKRQTEREGIKKEVSGFRKRLGSVIREHMSFPDEFDSHKIRLDHDYSESNDWIEKVENTGSYAIALD